MTLSYRRQVRAWLVLLVAIGTVLGHVCMGPLNAHADDAASAAPGPGGHDDSDDGAVHCASYEALRTAPAQLSPSAVVASALASPLPPLARETARVPATVFCPESPPLFLLHAALLI
jgi:hypothetical protein